MNLVNVRIDDRLVHGQVATQWTPKLKIERIICIDDESANNPMLKSALRMATPKSVFLSTLTFDTALANLQADKYGNERVLIVTKSPATILKLIEGGIKIDTLILGNLGNQKRTEDSTVITKYITVNPVDIENCKKLEAAGVNLIAQMSPEDTPVDLMKEINRKVKG